MRFNAEIVCLSSCDLAAGKLAGPAGSVSLAQFFLFAGARTVVASVWGADDLFTSRPNDYWTEGLFPPAIGDS